MRRERNTEMTVTGVRRKREGGERHRRKKRGKEEKERAGGR